MSDIKTVFKESLKKMLASINPGTQDISGIGDGTIKGAIHQLNEKMRAGTISVSGLGATSKSYTVTFDTPMKDTSYSVSLEKNFASYFNELNYAIYEKRTDGFTIRVSNSNASANSITYVFDWIAIAH